MKQTVAVELLRCWRGRWAERTLVMAIAGLVAAFVLGAVILVREFSAPEASLRTPGPRVRLRPWPAAERSGRRRPVPAMGASTPDRRSR